MKKIRGLARTLRKKVSSAPWVSTLVHQIGPAKVVGIAWHNVTEQSADGLQNYSGKHICVRQFEEQLRQILSAHRVLPVSEIVEALRDTKPLPRGGVFLSFDDGYRGLYDNALEVLTKYRLSAAVFLPTAFLQGIRLDVDILDAALLHSKCKEIDYRCDSAEQVNLPLRTTAERLSASETIRYSIRRNHKVNYEGHLTRVLQSLGFEDRSSVPLLCPDEQPLSWEQVREMQNAGIEFGSHSHSHRSMTSLSLDLEQAELSTSKSIIEQQTGKPCTLFAYPFGKPGIDNNDETCQMVARAGFEAAFLTGGGHVRSSSNVFALRRNTVTARTTPDDLQSILATAGHSILHRNRY